MRAWKEAEKVRTKNPKNGCLPNNKVVRKRQRANKNINYVESHGFPAKKMQIETRKTPKEKNPHWWTDQQKKGMEKETGCGGSEMKWIKTKI